MGAVPIVSGIGFSTPTGQGDLAALDDGLARIADLGVEYAELSLFGEDVIVGGRVEPQRLERLRRICQRHPLRYTVHGAIVGNLMDRAHLHLHKQVCRAMIELTAAIGGQVLVQHTGRVPSRSMVQHEADHALERACLEELGEFARPLGVRIAVENLFIEDGSLYTADPQRLAAEIAAIGHPNVCGTLDFSHAYIMATYRGLDFAEVVRTFAPYVNHLHVHDSFGRPRTMACSTTAEALAYGLGDLHLPIGWGDIPWDQVLPGLPLRRGTVMIVELFSRYWSELASCAAAARRLQALINEDGGRVAAQ